MWSFKRCVELTAARGAPEGLTTRGRSSKPLCYPLGPPPSSRRTDYSVPTDAFWEVRCGAKPLADILLFTHIHTHTHTHTEAEKESERDRERWRERVRDGESTEWMDLKSRNGCHLLPLILITGLDIPPSLAP